jgi:hypothetical protein
MRKKELRKNRKGKKERKQRMGNGVITEKWENIIGVER